MFEYIPLTILELLIYCDMFETWVDNKNRKRRVSDGEKSVHNDTPR
jgi:hypothetical protein